MSSIYSRTFWQATAERGIKTIAQAAGAMLVANGTGLLNTDWLGIVSVAGMAGLVSVLTSIGSDALTGTGPGLGNAEIVGDKVIVQETRSGLAVAGPAYVEDEHGDDIPEGTPVDVAPIEPTEDGEPTPGDVEADEVHENLPMPEGFSDGSDPARRYLDADGDGTPDRLN